MQDARRRDDHIEYFLLAIGGYKVPAGRIVCEFGHGGVECHFVCDAKILCHLFQISLNVCAVRVSMRPVGLQRKVETVPT